MTTHFSTQHLAFSNNSTDPTISSSSNEKKQYGPISVRVCRKSMPTLQTGRRSKHLILVGEAAIKRERRREKNREAARKLKEKRHLIEDELAEKVTELETQHSRLQNFIDQLQQQKLHLVYEFNQQLLTEMDQLLCDDNDDNPSASEQYSPDMDLFGDAIEEVLNDHLKSCYDLSPQN